MTVLILVVVDVFQTSMFVSENKKTYERLNPCCSGCVSNNKNGYLEFYRTRLNPCCSGCVSNVTRKYPPKYRKNVLILVVVDVFQTV